MEPGPDFEAHQHRHSGIRWFDVLLGGSAVAISLISLLIALENGDAMKRLVEANSWPFVQVGVSNLTADDSDALILLVQNKGVGPAKIETMEVFYEDRPMRDARSLVHAILGPQAKDKRIPLGRSDIVGGVLSSKETVEFLIVKDKSIDPSDLKLLALGAGRVSFKTCYCSVFDECWVLNRTKGTPPATPVKLCPKPKTPYDQE